MQARAWIGSLGIAILLGACGDGGSSGGNLGVGGSNPLASAGGAPGAAGMANSGSATGGSPGTGGSLAAGGNSTTMPAMLKGVNLSCAEFGNTNLPGVYGTDYTYPTTTEVDYFMGKRMNVFRLPFRWERLQRTLNASFDAAEQGRIDQFVNYATGRGAYVVLDPHNFGRYSNQIIGAGVANSAFADFWRRLADLYRGNSRVIFGLMNEPHDLNSSLTADINQWLAAANAAIQAIRGTGASNLIMVPGSNWTGAHSWVSSGNAQIMLGVNDPANNYAYEVHQYLDSDYSGTHTTCVSTTVGSTALAAITNWLGQNGRRAFLGEFGGSTNQTCLAAIGDLLGYIDQHTDVWMGWAYWAAGPWWGNSAMVIEPQNGQDRPQMAVLSQHL
jgi:endoglucanase